MLDDWLAAEVLIINRLKAEVGAYVRDVLGARELAALSESQQPSPSLHVIYDGEDLSVSSGGHGEARIVEQFWLVVVAVESASEIVTGEGERLSIGRLMSRVIRALSGHQLSADFRKMERRPAPQPAFATPWAYYPMLFGVKFAGA
jgi:hypothetical protein